ncbi:MAG: pyruvate kinase [Desulfobacterales bacterium]|nr:pyruvate kinase [Desulfobacterales bacterium]
MTKTTMKRHVKIVCTLGPASSSPEVVGRMLKAGMDVARFNLAHGTLQEHSRLISEVRSISQKLKLPVGILLDLPGLKFGHGDIKAVFGQHLDFALTEDADFIALSFVSSVRQVREVKQLLRKMKADIPVIVKIEKVRALEKGEAILEAGEGIMVARGDLALDISIEKVPMAQKRLIKEANRQGKPVITATQMLESMVRSATPTRAEATDVANAVLDGSDALMLSEETAIGSYPIEAMETMVKIVLEAEAIFPYEEILHGRWQDILPEVNDAAARAACQMAHQVQAKAIVAFTTAGTTALRVSKYRPYHPILAITPSASVVRCLSLAWGVLPLEEPEPANLEEVFELASQTALETNLAKRGDLIAIIAGIPLAVPGSTNLVKIHGI